MHLEEFTMYLESPISLASLLVVGSEVSDIGPDYGVSKKPSEYELEKLSVNSYFTVEHLVFGVCFCWSKLPNVLGVHNLLQIGLHSITL